MFLARRSLVSTGAALTVVGTRKLWERTMPKQHTHKPDSTLTTRLATRLATYVDSGETFDGYFERFYCKCGEELKLDPNPRRDTKKRVDSWGWG